jgi:hypothetical protein
MATKSESFDKVVSKRKKSVIKTDKSENKNEITESKNIDNESKIEELSKMVVELSKQLASIQAQTVTNQQPIYIQRVQDQPNVVNSVQPNEYIKVMSLLDNRLNLSTRDHGMGKTYSFDEFGETQDILYSDLMEINSHHRNFLQAGYYYILDDRVVALAGKNEAYKHILTKEQIERILSNENDAISLFQKSNQKQQEVIVKFICKKIINNENIDYNLVEKLSKVSEVDIKAKAEASIEAKTIALDKENQ